MPLPGLEVAAAHGLLEDVLHDTMDNGLLQSFISRNVETGQLVSHFFQPARCISPPAVPFIDFGDLVRRYVRCDSEYRGWLTVGNERCQQVTEQEFICDIGVDGPDERRLRRHDRFEGGSLQLDVATSSPGNDFVPGYGIILDHAIANREHLRRGLLCISHTRDLRRGREPTTSVGGTLEPAWHVRGFRCTFQRMVAIYERCRHGGRHLWLAGALAACHAAEPPPATPAVEPPLASAPTPAATYLVIYRPGAQWPADGSMPPVLRDHFRYLLGLHQQGILERAGPFASTTGGAAVLRAPDDAAAQALLDADPAIVAKVFEAELRHWSPVDWAARAAAPK